ncbi:MAG: YkgJ family cysteine cluster protein [Candidatus Heimdallarchaeota archaeon]
MVGHQSITPGNVCLLHKCHHCCKETEMILSKADIDRISKSTSLRPLDFSFINSEGHKVLQNEVKRVKGDEGEYCVFLNTEGKCTIYSNRPNGCRFYPVIWDHSGHLAILDDYCPYASHFDPPGKKIENALETFILKIYGLI